MSESSSADSSSSSLASTQQYESPFQVKRFKTSTASLPIFEHQSLAWENLKKTITNQLNKLNKSNLPIIVNELFKHNIIRGVDVGVGGPGLHVVAEDNQQTHMIELLDSIITDRPIDDDRMNINQPHNNHRKDVEQNIYLSIQSVINAEQCAYKLLHQILLSRSQEMIVCEKRVYDPFFGILSEQFCKSKNEYSKCFEHIFSNEYNTAHRRKNIELENTSKLFCHLMITKSMSYFSIYILRKKIRTSSTQVFLRYLFIELANFLGDIAKLYKSLTDSTLAHYFDSIFRHDNEKDIEFAIQFLSTTGLSNLT
ncbi:unnamed protein product, partial [Adineta steineri]|uniref:MI domain-containing protein n=1 Tax=Adineta steineri TaxID=433720 RepID=A0A819HMB0_9BILA